MFSVDITVSLHFRNLILSAGAVVPPKLVFFFLFLCSSQHHGILHCQCFTALLHICDQDSWFDPKMASIREFLKTTKKWIADDHKHMMPNEAVQQEHATDELQEAVKPNDSASQVGDRNDADHSSRGSQVSHLETHITTKLVEFPPLVLNRKQDTQPCWNVPQR